MKFKGKEYIKVEGSCTDCACFDCAMRYGGEYRCTLPHGKIWIECKEKEKPKTKRVAVIWFGDVEEDTDTIRLYQVQYGGAEVRELTAEVDAIDLNRLRYDIPNIGDNYLSYIGIIKHQGYEVDKYSGLRLIIDPPTKPETVEEVMERMPLVSENRKAFLNGDDNATMSKYISKLEAWQKDLKAAQDREQDKKEE